MKRFLALMVCIGLLAALTGCVVFQVEEHYEEKVEKLPEETKPQPEETENPEPQETAPLIVGFFAEKETQGDVLFIGDETEYAVRLGFTAGETVSFTFSQLIWETQTYEVSEVLKTADLQKGQTFVAQVAFPGDMTTYGMTVTDENGSQEHYAVYISGMDGNLICQLYQPEPAPEREYTYYLGSFCYHIPVVKLPGVNAQTINDVLYETHTQNLKTKALDMPEQPFMLGMTYSVAQKGDIVSVMVQESCDCDLTDFYVYNFSASTGEVIRDEDVYAAFGLTQAQAHERIRSALTEYWDQRIQEFGAEGLESYKNNTISDENVASFRPFMDENGNLRYVGAIYSPAGADSYDWIIDDAGNAWRESCPEHQSDKTPE